MAQPSNNDNNNNNNSGNNTPNSEFLKKSASGGFKSAGISSQPKPMAESISYSKSKDGQAYRGTTLVANPIGNDIQGGVQYYQGRQVAKNEAKTNELYTVQSRVKSDGNSVLNTEQKTDVMNAEVKADINVDYKPWDGLSPLNTYSSSKYTPKEMISKIKDAFDNLVNDVDIDIDWDKYSDYQFEARTYTPNGELEFRINIFGKGILSDINTKTEIEIRRMSGNCFAFGDAESRIVDELLKSKCIDENQGNDIGLLKLNSFTECGFSATPLPFNIIESDSDVTIDEFNEDNALELIKDATDKKQYQSNYILAVQDLYDACNNNEYIKIIKNIDDVVLILLKSIKEDCYDAYAIKTILDCVSLLVKAGATYDGKTFRSDLVTITNKWSTTVVNTVGKAQFKFPKSQVITRKCEILLGLKKPQQ